MTNIKKIRLMFVFICSYILLFSWWVLCLQFKVIKLAVTWISKRSEKEKTVTFNNLPSEKKPVFCLPFKVIKLAVTWVFKISEKGKIITFNYILYGEKSVIWLPFKVIKLAVTWISKKSEKIKTVTFNNIPSEEKPVGLNNFSAECYMNSIIQALAACDTFIKKLDKMKVPLQTSDTNLDSLLDLLNSVNNPNSKSYENSQKLESLIRNVGWNKSAQQDTYELLSVIINCIDKEIKNRLNSKQFTMPLKVKVRHSFQGVKIDNRIQNYLGLSLGLSGNYSNYPGVSLKFLIEEHFAPVIIDDDPAKSSQIVFFKEIPEILLLHIQANKWDHQLGKMIKPDYHIKYDNEFCVKLAVADDQINEPKMYDVEYKLCAIVHHMGDISGGHYIAYRKWQNNWYLVNDEQVNKCDFKCDVCPYILIYEKWEA